VGEQNISADTPANPKQRPIGSRHFRVLACVSIRYRSSVLYKAPAIVPQEAYEVTACVLQRHEAIEPLTQYDLEN